MRGVLQEQLINNVAGIESSRREERTEKVWVEFSAPSFTGCIITDDSTSMYLSVLSVVYLHGKVFERLK